MEKESKFTSFYTILQNNWFIIKIVWNISKVRFIIKAIITLITAILPTINILIARYIITILENNTNREEEGLYQVTIVIFGMMLMQLLPILFRAWNLSVIEPILASKVNNYMNMAFFKKVREIDYKDFEDPVFYDKYTRALGESESITHMVFNTYFQLFASIISVSVLLTLIISMDMLVILFALFSVIMNFIQAIVTGKLNFETSQTLTPYSRMQNYMKRVLYNSQYTKDIKCYDVISTGEKYYNESIDKIINTLKKNGIKISIINSLVAILNAFSSMTMMLYLFVMVWKGIYSIANYSALMTSSNQLETALNTLLSTIGDFFKNSLEIDNLKFIYFYKRESSNGTIELNNEQPCEIEIKNLSFKYPNSNRYALKNISLKILPGEKISLVGLNGSGKTTLIKLLLRLYRPSSGKILLNGIDLSEYKEEDIQQKIGVVFQEHNIFAYSIKENISFEDKIKKEALNVLCKLDIYSSFDTLPSGIDTHLSKEFDDNGIILSGGEAQKVCIARAINRATGLYIFDEPSSALDPISEFEMNKLMRDITDKTTIFVSHRLSSVVMADKIFYLYNGELIESGTHDDLLILNGQYAKLFRIQAESYVDHASVKDNNEV